MTQEQKAKAYDEAIKKLKNFMMQGVDPLITRADVQDFFPELSESEDERIRRELLNFCKNRAENFSNDPKYKNISAWIAWLEKQGEQESLCDKCRKEHPSHSCQDITELGRCAVEHEQSPANKVEPKFKAGNWYQCTKDFFGKGVTFDKNTAYYCAREGCLQCEYGCHIAIVKDLYDNFKLWTIQDAKDGDILNANGAPFIYKKHDKDYIYFYCGVNLGGYFLEADGDAIWNSNNKIYPATKEQRELLFQKMKEAGYEWDAEKKELKITDFSKHLMYNPNAPSITEQKPAWSEEDKKKLNRIYILLAEAADEHAFSTTCRLIGDKECVELQDFIKSLKERIQN